MKKQQILYINWWDSKENYKDFIDYLQKLEYDPYKEKFKFWKHTFAEDLWENFFVLNPEMPNKDFASYYEWKIMFEKTFFYLEDEIILLWHSMWATFLTKYLNENNFPVKIKKIILIAGAFKDIPWDVIWDFNFDKNLEQFKKLEEKIIFFHSKDDNIVPYSHLEHFRKIFPDSEFHIFKNKGHFINETFKELIEVIKKI